MISISSFLNLILILVEERDIDFFGNIKLKVLLGYIPTFSGILSFKVTHLQVFPFEI